MVDIIILVILNLINLFYLALITKIYSCRKTDIGWQFAFMMIYRRGVLKLFSLIHTAVLFNLWATCCFCIPHLYVLLLAIPLLFFVPNKSSFYIFSKLRETNFFLFALVSIVFLIFCIFAFISDMPDFFYSLAALPMLWFLVTFLAAKLWPSPEAYKIFLINKNTNNWRIKASELDANFFIRSYYKNILQK